MRGDKLRFRFAKAGTLRLLSHHDLMRCLERMLRRADIPFKSSAGFHPTPRVVFALSLPLGVPGRDEVLELELTAPCDAADVLARLNAQAPAGLSFTRVSVVPMKATAIPRRVVYEFPLPAERLEAAEAAAADLLTSEKLWVERLRPSPKRLNIRPYVRGLEIRGPHPPAPVPATDPTPRPPPPRGEGERNQPVYSSPSPRGGGGRGVGSLHLDLWVTQTGTAKADEILRLLGLGDLLDAGVVPERTLVELRDEATSTDPNDQPPDGPADALPLGPAEVAALARREDEANQPAAAGGVSPHGPVVE